MESQLLDRAAELLRTTGEAPSLTALAAASGVSRATVYRVFGNQEALLARLRERGVVVPAEGEAVFAAVREVLRASGLDGFTVEAVARRAGVSVPTLHRRFGGRDALLHEFFDHLAPRTEAWRLPADGPAEGALATLAERVSAWLHADADLILAALAASPDTRRRLRETRAAGLGTHEALADWLDGRARAAGRPMADPRRAAQAFLGGVLGLTAAGPMSPDTARWWAGTFLAGLGLA